MHLYWLKSPSLQDPYKQLIFHLPKLLSASKVPCVNRRLTKINCTVPMMKNSGFELLGDFYLNFSKANQL